MTYVYDCGLLRNLSEKYVAKEVIAVSYTFFQYSVSPKQIFKLNYGRGMLICFITYVINQLSYFNDIRLFVYYWALLYTLVIVSNHLEPFNYP